MPATPCELIYIMAQSVSLGEEYLGEVLSLGTISA